MIKLILAINEVNAIGKDGGLMYRLKVDMLNFKEMTKGSTVVMGRKTYDSLKKPLADRVNFVVTNGGLSDADIEHKGPVSVLNSEGFLDLLKAHQTSEEVIWVIGGATLYEQAVGFASEIICTFIDGEEEGDTYLPDGLFGDFVQLSTLKQVDADEHNERTHDIVHLVRSSVLLGGMKGYQEEAMANDGFTFGEETKEVINATGEEIGFKVTGVHGDREVTQAVVFLDAEGNPLTPEAELDLNAQLSSENDEVIHLTKDKDIADEMVVSLSREEFKTLGELYKQNKTDAAFERLLSHYTSISPEFAELCLDFETLCEEHGKADGFKSNHVKNILKFRHISLRKLCDDPLTPGSALELNTLLKLTPLPTGKKFGTAVVRMLSIEEIVDGLEVHHAIDVIGNKEHELVVSLFGRRRISEAWGRLVKFYEIVCPETAKQRVAEYVTDEQQRDHVENVVTYGVRILDADDINHWDEDTVKQLLKNFTGAIS